MFKARHSLTEIPKIFSKEKESIHHMTYEAEAW